MRLTEANIYFFNTWRTISSINNYLEKTCRQNREDKKITASKEDYFLLSLGVKSVR